MSKKEKDFDEAKQHIAIALEHLYPYQNDDGDIDVDSIIRELQDIQILRLTL